MNKKITKGFVCLVVVGGLSAFGMSSASALDLGSLLGVTAPVTAVVKDVTATVPVLSPVTTVAAPVTDVVKNVTANVPVLSPVTNVTAPVTAVVTDVVNGGVLNQVVGGDVVKNVVGGDVLKTVVGGDVIKTVVGGDVAKDILNNSANNLLQEGIANNLLQGANFLNPEININCNNIASISNVLPINGIVAGLPLLSSFISGPISGATSSDVSACNTTTVTPTTPTTPVATPNPSSSNPVPSSTGPVPSVDATDIVGSGDPTGVLAMTGSTTAGIGGFAGLLALLAGLSLVVVARKRSVQA